MPEPISLPEAKAQIRVDVAGDDALITGYIVAAREWVEDYTGLVLTRREVTESYRGCGRSIRLRAWPIAAVEGVEISYRDTAGVAQTIANADLRAAARPAAVYPPLASSTWPFVLVDDAVSVTVTAGFATPAEVPQALKQAMLVLITAFYEDREGGELVDLAECTARRLCRRWKHRVL